jgi:hypothetical protein
MGSSLGPLMESYGESDPMALGACEDGGPGTDRSVTREEESKPGNSLARGRAVNRHNSTCRMRDDSSIAGGNTPLGSDATIGDQK